MAGLMRERTRLDVGDPWNFFWICRYGFGFRFWVLELQVYWYKPESHRCSYSVALESGGYNQLGKREAGKIFREVKLSFGESAVLSRTHRRTGVMTVLETRYQPDEEKAALDQQRDRD